MNTPERDPTTARHGDFWLLDFSPRPVRPSLANLHASASAVASILMVSLVWTLRQHAICNTQNPHAQINL